MAENLTTVKTVPPALAGRRPARAAAPPGCQPGRRRDPHWRWRRRREPPEGQRLDPPARTVEIGGRTLALSNLGKVLWPSTGFTEAQVVDYYARVAPVMLPPLGRPVGDPAEVARRGRSGVLFREELPAAPLGVGAGDHPGRRLLLLARRACRPGVDCQPGRGRAAPDPRLGTGPRPAPGTANLDLAGATAVPAVAFTDPRSRRSASPRPQPGRACSTSGPSSTTSPRSSTPSPAWPPAGVAVAGRPGRTGRHR